MIKVSYHGNPYIGIFARANESVALVPQDVHNKFSEAIEHRLKVKVIEVSLCSSSLIGIYSAMNSNAIIVPDIAYSDELKKIKRETGLDVCEIDTKNTAIGNLIVCNDKGAIISDAMEKENLRKIADALDVECVTARIAGYQTVGSACVATNNGFVLQNDAEGNDMELAERVLKVEGINSSVNFGFPFPGYGVIANTKGFVAGDKCTGIELMRVEQGLGFAKRI